MRPFPLPPCEARYLKPRLLFTSGILHSKDHGLALVLDLALAGHDQLLFCIVFASAVGALIGYLRICRLIWSVSTRWAIKLTSSHALELEPVYVLLPATLHASSSQPDTADARMHPGPTGTAWCVDCGAVNARRNDRCSL